MIAIIDYGVGNMASIKNMFKKIGAEAIITKKHNDIERAEKLVLPGVGAFDVAMEKLQDSNVIDVLKHAVLQDKIPLLGICLGMHLLCKTSEEGALPGLGLVNARVKRFQLPSDYKVPHMGWNRVKVANQPNHILCHGLAKDARFYFVHSYFVEVHDASLALLNCNYGGEFIAAFAMDNIMACQFHPEKSHKFGMRLFKNFAGL
ncbi:imidazole glycerol phosphate synthase subunit HisH [Alphaproteobacteria bacterium]|nr:imidazole glycerol phosphate synthase subunit HisH [Alphaproteobacteria bacterium]